MIAALTVGGKAPGKTFAITYSKDIDIIFRVGKLMQFLEDKCRISLLNDNKKKKQKHQNKKRK